MLLKRLAKVEMLHLMVWLSLVPPLPALALSMMFDGPASLPHALTHASWMGIAAALHLGIFATVVAYALWGNLLRRYPTAAVAPFALLAPCVGVVSSAWIFGEQFGPLRLAGMALMLLGLAIIVLPLGSVFAPRLRRR